MARVLSRGAQKERGRDLDHANVPEAVSALLERLAERTHEAWAARRLAEGWRWGPERSDARKEHPCLVPYAQLPEAEKDYDRGTALAVLRDLSSEDWEIVQRASLSG